MMLIGESLIEGTTDAPGPWFERCGDAATFALWVINLTTNDELNVTVQTKNKADDDASASDIAVTSIISVGVATLRATGLKELVRFVYGVAAIPIVPPPSGGGVNFKFAHFCVLPPAWEDNLLRQELDAT